MTTTIRGTDNTAAAPALTGTDTDTGIFFPAADTIAFAEGGVEIARFDSSGNLGIGTSSPIARLQLVNSSANCAVIIDGQNATARGAFINLKKGGTDTAYIGQASGILGGASTSNDLLLWADGSINQLFYTNGSERVRIDSNGQMRTTNGAGSVALAYDARVWVNFNGVGTVSIRGSGNVSTITDNGVGDYTVNFATAMPDVNYSTVTGVLFGSIGNKGGIELDQTGSFPTASAVRLRTYTSSTTAADSLIVNIAVFR